MGNGDMAGGAGERAGGAARLSNAEVYQRAVGAITARAHKDKIGYKLVVGDLRGTEWIESLLVATCAIAVSLADELVLASGGSRDEVLDYIGRQVAEKIGRMPGTGD